MPSWQQRPKLNQNSGAPNLRRNQFWGPDNFLANLTKSSTGSLAYAGCPLLCGVPIPGACLHRILAGERDGKAAETSLFDLDDDLK